jgi:hypothetical protein
MKYLGDYAEDYATLNLKFSTHTSAGTPITLAGTPAVSVYKANGTTQSTAGITLTVDFDGVTGLHNVLIDLSADAFYATANDYAVVITTGTVDGVSVVGTTLAHFSIQNRSTVAIKAGGITAASFAAGAIDAAAIANNAIDSATLATDVTARIASAVWDAVRASYATAGSFGDIDTTADIADGVLDEVVEGSYTLRQLIRLIAAAAGAKLSGAATTSVAIRDFADTKNRIVATVDADGNRTPTSYDLT